MNLAVGQRVKVRVKGSRGKDRIVVGLVAAMSNKLFTVQTLLGYKESFNYIDAKHGHIEIALVSGDNEINLETEECEVKDVENGVRDVNAMTDDEIQAWLEECGIKGQLSADMIRKHPPELMRQLVVEEGLTYNDLKKRLSIATATIANLKKLYGLTTPPKPKAKKIKVTEEPEKNIKKLVKMTEDQEEATSAAAGNPIIQINFSGSPEACTRLSSNLTNILADMKYSEDENMQLTLQVVVSR